MIEAKLNTALESLVDGRVFPSVLPMGFALPAIVYITSGVDPNNTICGASDDEEVRIQVDLYAKTMKEVLSLRKQVFTAIEGAFESVIRMNDFDGYEPDTKLFRRIIEFSISY